jgi:dihydroorotase
LIKSSCKTAHDRKVLWEALMIRIDVIATDHAHTLEEKTILLKAPSGGPLVQHAVVAMFDREKISVEWRKCVIIRLKFSK